VRQWPKERSINHVCFSQVQIRVPSICNGRKSKTMKLRELDMLNLTIILCPDTFIVKNIIETQTYTGAAAKKARMVARM